MKPRAAIARGESIEWLRPRAARTNAAKRSNWKVGASVALPLVDDGLWDHDAAAAGIFEASDMDTPWGDGRLARKAHLVYDASFPHLKSSYRYLFARLIDGELTADREGVEQAARSLARAHDLSTDVLEKARAVVTRYRVGR